MIYKPTIMDAIQDAKAMVFESRNNWDSYFGKYSPFYHITTECVSTYVDAMGNNFKTGLTLGASGDQGIALTQRGAKDVYFFDLNRADIHWIMLKKTAFETLRRKDFLDFIIAESNGEILNYHLYQLIRDKLTAPTKTFWDTIYKMFNYNSRLISIHLFRDTKKFAQKSRIVNDYYASNKVYYDTQEKVKNSNWHVIESDFFDLDKKLPKGVNFDAIILSNIYEYINFGKNVSRDNAIKYLEFIKTILLPRLNQDGACMSAYIYRFDDETNEFIKNQLANNPAGWVPSSDFLSGVNNIEKFFAGYTGQNVSYHYLYEILKQESGVQKVKTKNAGFGMSSATTDLAIIQKK